MKILLTIKAILNYLYNNLIDLVWVKKIKFEDDTEINTKPLNLFDIKCMSEAIANKNWCCISDSQPKRLNKADVPTAYNFLKDKLDNVEGSISAISSFVWNTGQEFAEFYCYDDYVYIAMGNHTTLYRSKIEDIGDTTKWETILTQYRWYGSYSAVFYGKNLALTSSDDGLKVINLKTGQVIKTISGYYVNNNDFFTFNNNLYFWSGSPLLLYKIPDIDTSNADDITIENVACSKFITNILAYKDGYYAVCEVNGSYANPLLYFRTTDLNDDTKYEQLTDRMSGVGLFASVNNGLIGTRTVDGKFGFTICYDWTRQDLNYPYVSPTFEDYGNLIDFSKYGKTGTPTRSYYNKINNGYLLKYQFGWDDNNSLILFTNDFINFQLLGTNINISRAFGTTGQFVCYYIPNYADSRLYYSQPSLVLTVFTDTYTINGSSVNIKYYKSNDWKICTPDIAVGNDDNLQSVYEYLGYLNYWWIDTANEQITLQRNSNLWTFMYVGDDYEDSSLPSGIATRLLPQKNYVEDTTSATITFDEDNIIQPNTDYIFGALTSLEFDTDSYSDNQLETTIKFTADTGFSFTDNSGITWVDGTPTFTAGNSYLILIFNGLAFIKEY